MNQRDFVIKWLLYAAASLLLFLLQGLLFNHLRILHTHPFVFPFLVGIIAVWEKPVESGFYALAFGLACDLIVPGDIPCLYTVSFLLTVVLCVLISEKLIVPGFACSMVCSVVSLVIYQLINCLIQHYRHSAAFIDCLMLMGRELLLSIVLAPLVYLLFHQIRLRTAHV